LLECLPNLPAAQLAIEIAARGPVESRRGRSGEEGAIFPIMERWIQRGIRRVVWVRCQGEKATAEIWSK
jgi:hypothetical protein